MPRSSPRPSNVVTARGLPRDLRHIYVMFLPKHVESCFFAGSTTTGRNSCTINYQPSAAYCAYHSQAPNGTVYANLPFPIYDSRRGSPAVATPCSPSSRRRTGTPTPTPRSARRATRSWRRSPTRTSHRLVRLERLRERRRVRLHVRRRPRARPASVYNQVIGRHHYLTQEEFSNRDFADRRWVPAGRVTGSEDPLTSNEARQGRWRKATSAASGPNVSPARVEARVRLTSACTHDGRRFARVPV